MHGMLAFSLCGCLVSASVFLVQKQLPFKELCCTF